MSMFGIKERIFGSSVDGPGHHCSDALASLAEKAEQRDGKMFEEVIMGPLQEAIRGPLQEAIIGPLQEAIRGPLQEAIIGPLQEAIRGPLQEALGGPLHDAIMGQVQEVIRVPFQEAILPLTATNSHNSRAMMKPTPRSVTEHCVRHHTRDDIVKIWRTEQPDLVESSPNQPGTPYPVSRLETKDSTSKLLQFALFATEVEEKKTEMGDKLIVEDEEIRHE